MSPMGILLCSVLVVVVWLTLSTAITVAAPYIAALVVVGIIILVLINYGRNKGP